MNAHEATQIWAKKKLDAENISYSEDDVFMLEQEIGWEGCCSMCVSDSIQTNIVNQRYRELLVVHGDVSFILDEIIETALGEAN